MPKGNYFRYILKLLTLRGIGLNDGLIYFNFVFDLKLVALLLGEMLVYVVF